MKVSTETKKKPKRRLSCFNRSADVPAFTKRGTWAWYVIGETGPRRGPYMTEEAATKQSWGTDVVKMMKV